MTLQDTSVCPSEAALEALAGGGADDGLRGHLEDCSRCRQIVADIRENDPFLRQMIPAARRTRGRAPGFSRTRGAVPEIAGYRVLTEISRGSQGVVYKAIQLAAHREVAVKILFGSGWAHPSQQRRFERELE